MELLRVHAKDETPCFNHDQSFNQADTTTPYEEDIRTEELEVANLKVFQDLGPMSRAVK
jgi:hypothetical protein